MTARLSRVCYGLSLVTLPWVGVDLLSLTTGRDWGWGLQPSWLLLAAAMLFAAADRWARRSGTDDPTWPPVPNWWLWGAIAVAVALGLSLVGLWWAPSTASVTERCFRWGKQVVQLGIMAAFVAWPAVWTRGDDRWRLTGRWLALGLLGQVGYGVLQAVDYFQAVPLFEHIESWATSNPSILAGSDELYLGGTMREIPRLRGTMCEPLYLASYVIMAAPLAVVATRHRIFRWLLGVAAAGLLLGTWSRGAWLAAAAAAAVMVCVVRLTGRLGVARWRPGRQALLTAGLVLTGGLLLWWVEPGALRLPFERLIQSFDTRDWSNLTRLYSIQAAWRAFLISPLFGVGWGQFGFHFPLLVDAQGLQSQFSWPVVNNFPLKVLCETGLIGGLALIALVGRLGRDTLAGLRRSFDPRRRRTLLAATAAWLAVWIQLLTFSQYNLPHIWVATGLLLAALEDGKASANGAVG